MRVFDNNNLCQDAIRLKHILDTRGFEEALDFAKRTCKIYRSSVKSKRVNFTQFEPYRSRFVRSYLLHKRFIDGKLRYREGVFYEC